MSHLVTSAVSDDKLEIANTELALIGRVWPFLPNHLREAIMLMVQPWASGETHRAQVLNVNRTVGESSDEGQLS